MTFFQLQLCRSFPRQTDTRAWVTRVHNHVVIWLLRSYSTIWIVLYSLNRRVAIALGGRWGNGGGDMDSNASLYNNFLARRAADAAVAFLVDCQCRASATTIMCHTV